MGGGAAAAVGVYGSTAVTIGGDPQHPDVLDRRPIPTRDGQPYHQAVDLPIAEAERVIEEAGIRACDRATDAIETLVLDLAAGGLALAVAGLVFKTYRLPSSLATLLRSHPLCHAAEGQMTRDALGSALDAAGLVVVATPDAELPAYAAQALGVDVDTELARMGKAAGPPWRKEHKLAVLAAWIALETLHASEEA